MSCSHISFKQMNVADLYKKSALTVECLDGAQEVFYQKYRDAILIFRGPLIEDMIQAITEFDDGQSILVRNSITISHFLRHFGRFVGHIWLDLKEIDINKSKRILKSINDHCSSILFKLRLINCQGNVLDVLKNPFVQTSELSFSSSKTFNMRYSVDNPTMSELFPRLNNLQVQHTRCDDIHLFY